MNYNNNLSWKETYLNNLYYNIMKIKNLLSVVFAVAIGASTFAQSNLLNSKTPDEIGKKTPAQLISDNDKPLP